MRFRATIAAAGLAAFVGVSAAQAGPMMAAPLAASASATPDTHQAIDTGPAPKIELVRGGCGVGFHRTLHGFCVPNAWHRWGWHRWGSHRWGWGWHRWGWHRWHRLW